MFFLFLQLLSSVTAKLGGFIWILKLENKGFVTNTGLAQPLFKWNDKGTDMLFILILQTLLKSKML